MNKFERFGSRRETKLHPADMLKGILENQSRTVNEMLAQEGLSGELLNPDASINPEGYAELYGAETIETDRAFVREREIEFTSANNPNVQDFYRSEFGAQTEDEIIARWRENKSREKSGQMEMAITALLSQKLGADFLVVRTAARDDYHAESQVDNLILDRVTGDVVGAFDEVHEGGDGSRLKKKQEKIFKIAKRGGAEIRYGFKMENGKLARAGLTGVPVFYLGLDSTALGELIQGLGENNQEKTDVVFTMLLASLEEQRAELAESIVPGKGANAAPSEFARRLDSFGRSLARIYHR